MKKLINFLPILLILIMACNQPKETKISYPDTKKVDTTDTYFGVKVPDPYRWLEDDNSDETREWVIAENKITDSFLMKIPFREKLRERYTQLWNYPKYGVPDQKGDYLFFMKNDGLQNQNVLYVQKGFNGEPKVLLDPNTLSEDGTIALSDFSISNDAKYLAYSLATAGSDWNEIRVLDIETGENLIDHITWVKFSTISWKGDGFYYSAYQEPEIGEEYSGVNEYHKVFYHKLGTDQIEDIIVFENKNHPLRNYYAGVTEDERFLVIYETESTSGNTLYCEDLRNKKSGFKRLTEGFDNEYNVVDNIGGNLIVRTNYQAPKWKLISINPKNPQPENWKTIIDENEEVLQSAYVMEDRIIAEYMKDAYSKAMIYDKDGNFMEEMNLPGIGSMSGLSSKKGGEYAFYGFTSFTFPSTVYKYDIKNNRSEIYKQSEIDFDPENYTTEQIFFESKDGTKVPMFLVHKKDLHVDGNNPTILYGYGGFNVSMTPYFSTSRLLFLEQGGIYVVVNLRGGGEYGVDWHKAGILMQKQNVFDDFIAAAEYLIDNNYTNPGRIAIVAGPNGGLLVGACMTQRPDLFGVAIPMVGVMDMLRYHKFTIGWAWASDYGTSEDSKEMFEYLYGYSPLHNIKEGIEYPATLVTTADHDDRVVPAHSFKFIAELQEKGGGTNPYLIRIETRAGHGGGKPTSKIIEEIADVYSFILYNMGVEPEL